MVKKISYLLISISLLLLSVSVLIKTLEIDQAFAKGQYEVPRSQLSKFQVVSYKNLLGLFDPSKGQIYFYKDNIYIKTFKIAEPGANLLILY